MIGEFSHSIDGKGRLFIPAKFRESLGPVFIITRGLGYYLSVYHMDEWNDLQAKIKTLPREDALELQRYFLAPAQECVPDSQGRVLISQKLRAHANLDKTAAVVGMGDHIDIWDEAAWNKTDTTPERIAAIMRGAGL